MTDKNNGTVNQGTSHLPSLDELNNRFKPQPPKPETPDISKMSESEDKPVTPVTTDAQVSQDYVAPTHSSDTYLSNSQGLSGQELNDPNQIKVTIADKSSPIIVLFGPPSCGKTMTLVRLTRYLRDIGVSVDPVTSFRPSYDDHYTDMCENFSEMVASDDAADSTSSINFMLVRVMINQRTVCQILEAPGEYYFSPDRPNAPFPRYVNNIINSDNRKIWIFMVEPAQTNKRMGEMQRNLYVERINKVASKMRPRDSALFLFNKIDETGFVRSQGNVNIGSAIKEMKDLYPGITSRFRNVNPLTSWFSPEKFSFIPFHTGDYSRTQTGTLTYDQGPDIYPRRLWETIRKFIRG